MDEAWERLKKKWPAYRIDESDACFFDLASCQFVGEGPHEFVVYSFGRLTRQAVRSKAATYPLAVQFGIHYPDFVSDEEPAIGHLRTSFSSDPTGLLEPIQILAIISTTNGPALWETLHDELTRHDTQTISSDWRQHEVWYDSHVDHILKALRSIDHGHLPTFEPMKPLESCAVSISLDDFPKDPFPGYQIDCGELSATRRGKWAYEMKKHLRAGGTGEQPTAERIILREDLRRVDPSLFKGQLGWTVPEVGFSIKPGRTSLQVAVSFDSGIGLHIDIYWIEFVREELAEGLSDKIIESFRGTPYDADPLAAAKWKLDLPYFDHTDCKIVGKGLDEVYAYTYRSAADEVIADGKDRYPMKIGYTCGLDGAVQRVASQFPSAIAHDTDLQFIGRCDNGRSAESKIHKALQKDNRRIQQAIGKEWFWTSANEVRQIFKNATGEV